MDSVMAKLSASLDEIVANTKDEDMEHDRLESVEEDAERILGYFLCSEQHSIIHVLKFVMKRPYPTKLEFQLVNWLIKSFNRNAVKPLKFCVVLFKKNIILKYFAVRFILSFAISTKIYLYVTL